LLGEPSLNLVETFDEAESFVRWLGERRQILAVDTETGGLEWWKDGLRLVQFGDLSAGWAIPWHLWSGLILDVLGRYEGDIVFHNLKFDLKYLEHHGVTLNRAKLHDTRAMAHIIDPTKPTGLKPLAIRLIDNTAGSGQDDLKSAMAKNGWTWATVPHDLPAYWVYSALDTVLTAHLYAELFPQIVTGFREVYELEIASTLVLNDMEVRGARIDLDYCEEKLVLLSTYADDMREWVQDNYNLAAGSNPAVAGRLQRRLVGGRERARCDRPPARRRCAEHPQGDQDRQVVLHQLPGHGRRRDPAPRHQPVGSTNGPHEHQPAGASAAPA
jgi:hypothetical protein